MQVSSSCQHKMEGHACLAAQMMLPLSLQPHAAQQANARRIPGIRSLTQQLAGQQQRQALSGQVSPKGTGLASGLWKPPLQTKAKAAAGDKDAHIVQLEAEVCR